MGLGFITEKTIKTISVQNGGNIATFFFKDKYKFMGQAW